jgi:hypothetical protein
MVIAPWITARGAVAALVRVALAAAIGTTDTLLVLVGSFAYEWDWLAPQACVVAVSTASTARHR